MIQDFLGKTIKVGDTLAFAHVRGNSATIGLRKVVSLKDKNGGEALIVVEDCGIFGEGRPRQIYRNSNCIIIDSE